MTTESAGAGRVRSLAFRPDIEGLRGIAVLLVVAFHCDMEFFAGGFIGVDVFFVLSGYLITGLLVAEIEKKSRLSLIEFYSRRARRLLPASTLVLLVSLLLAGLIMAPQEIQFAGRAARATSVYLSNMFFSVNAADYFAPGVETNPMLHTWSLAVQEQFYFFWPLLIMLGLQVWKSRRALVGVLTVLTVLSFAACLWLTANHGTFAFYGLPARAWEFGSGGLAALVPCGALGFHPRGWRLMGWFGVATVFAGGCFIGVGQGFPGWLALIPCVGTIAALMAGAEVPNSGAGRLLDVGVLQFLGKLSYSWYLWHWQFLVFAEVAYPGIAWWGKAAAALAALGASMLTYRTVENPIRFHPVLTRRPRLTLVCAAVVTACSFSVAALTVRMGTELADTAVMRNIAAAVGDVADMPREKCVTLGDSSEVKQCLSGPPSSDRSLVLFGDSHAIHWFNAVQRLAKERGWKLNDYREIRLPGHRRFHFRRRRTV